MQAVSLCINPSNIVNTSIKLKEIKAGQCLINPIQAENAN